VQPPIPKAARSKIVVKKTFCDFIFLPSYKMYLCDDSRSQQR
jgi:hypothetical protein